MLEGNIFKSNDVKQIANALEDDMMANAEELASQRQFELMPIEDQIRELKSQVKKPGKSKKKRSRKDVNSVPIASTPDE